MALTIRVSPSRCIRSFSVRHYNTESASTTAVNTQTSEEINNREKMSALSQLRNLTSSQLKAFNQYSKLIVQSAYEQGVTSAVNKQLVRMMQKIPTLLGTSTEEKQKEDIPTVKKEKEVTTIKEKTTNTVSTNDNNTYAQVLNNLANFTKQNAIAANSNQVKWKTLPANIITKDALTIRTRQVVAAIALTEDRSSRLKRLEDFINHLSKYPQAKSLAVKHGAINTLLRMYHQNQDYDSKCAFLESLTMLGHVRPLTSKGIRILSMDGGGTRGLVVIELLRKLEELTGRKVCEMFDYICGVSTGAIMAMLFGPHKKNLHDCAAMYREISAKIFTQNVFWGASNLLWSHAYYDTPLWEKILQQNIGEIELIKTSRDPECPKVSTVSAVVNQKIVRPFVFRNYELPEGVPALYTGTSRASLWQAVRASAAAPAYFEEFKLGDLLHQDGGILVNNPTAIAIHEAKLLWPGEEIQCVVSFGTGRNHPVGMNGENSNGTDSYSSWKTKFSKILDSATDTEAVHSILHDLLPDGVYYRFNPYVHEIAPMSEIRPEKLEQFETDAKNYARRNEDKFKQVAACLTQQRSYYQRTQDWIKSQSIKLASK